VPAAHCVQDLAPAAVEVPAGHVAHTDAFVAPSPFRKSSCAVPPGQGVHDDAFAAPSAPLYEPCGQTWQPSGG
jgi:hypothetical protein